MQIRQHTWTKGGPWRGPLADPDADAVLYFGGRACLQDGARHRELRSTFPRAQLLGCTTGGHLIGHEVEDHGVSAVSLHFDSTRVRLACEPIADPAESEACGAAIGRALNAEGLAGIILLSDGLHVNGSRLVAGITQTVGPSVPVCGGLAGDGDQFVQTLVGAGDEAPASHRVAALGFYGSALRFGYGCAGGWDSFGPFRRVTQAEGNVLHALDGEPALDLYERYLGEEAAGLPGTGLLFPLRIWDPRRPEHDIVRTILGVDRAARTMTFAGDVPHGWSAQLMRGAMQRLVAGASQAAGLAVGGVGHVAGDRLGIVISCIGRRLLMGQRVDEEIDAVAAGLGAGVTRVGFFSYGEIAPHAASGACELHNQAMTVTAIAEAALV